MEHKEGTCCTTCGGMVPGSVKIRRILIDGKEACIDRLDQVRDKVIGRGIPGG